MTFINYASREINCKIVYYGPGLCGKTTNIQWIYEQANPEKRGKVLKLHEYASVSVTDQLAISQINVDKTKS